MLTLESVLQGKIQSKRIQLVLYFQDSSSSTKSKDKPCVFSLQHMYILIITTYTLNKVHTVIMLFFKSTPKWYILPPTVYILVPFERAQWPFCIFFSECIMRSLNNHTYKDWLKYVKHVLVWMWQLWKVCVRKLSSCLSLAVLYL